MKKIVIILITIISIALFCLIGGWIYFVGQFSAVYPPITKYVFSTDIIQFEEKTIDVVNKNPSFSYKLKDVTGTDEPRNHYMDIDIKKNAKKYIFNVFYVNKENFWTKKQYVELNVVGAFEQTTGKGGYKIDDEEVKVFINLFEKEIVERIRN